MKFHLEEELAQLSQIISKLCETTGAAIIEKGEAACNLETLWLQYLRASQLTGTADSLIDGTASAIRQGICCTALGLVRPALSSFRLQIDLSLSWLYFKDHPVEWRRVQESGEGYKMKSEIIKYLGESSPRFSDRFGQLRNLRGRTLEDPYRLLSAHLHGQSQSVLPEVRQPRDIVSTPQEQDEALKLQTECSEYLNDIFWSLFADNWAGIPAELRTTLEARFKKATQRSNFFLSQP